MRHFAVGDHLFITDRKCRDHPDYHNEAIAQDAVIIDQWESKGYIKVVVRVVSDSPSSLLEEYGSQGVS